MKFKPEQGPEKILSREDIVEGMKTFPENVQLIFRRLLELHGEQKTFAEESIRSINNQFEGMSDVQVSERIFDPTEIQTMQSKNEGDYFTNRSIEIANEQSYFWEQLGKVSLESIDAQRALADYRQQFTNFLQGK